MTRIRLIKCILGALLVALCVTACSDKGADEGSGTVDTPTVGTDVGPGEIGAGLAEADLEFGLTQPSTPEFEEGLQLGVDGAPDSNVGITVPGTVEPMYTERGGYAYRLDPATLEPTGGPLDHVTYLPVDPTQSEPVTSDTPGDRPSAEEPSEDTKYPNTGIFLEDD